MMLMILPWWCGKEQETKLYPFASMMFRKQQDWKGAALAMVS